MITRRARRRRIWNAAVTCATIGVLAGALLAAGRWDDRLEALRPERPLAYLELAEEVADESDDAAGRALARRLFALAGILDPEGLGRSAALALADLEDEDLPRRRLLALAGLLGREGLAPSEPVDTEADLGPEHTFAAVMSVTEAFSEYRRGRGPQALSALRDPGATALLESCDHLLPGGAHRFIEDCRLYRGQLRPSLSDRSLARMLRLELALLSGRKRTWSGDLLLRTGAPLLEVDPDQIEATLGVDGSRPYYRDGGWARTADGR
jgi:hypothetical protein